MILYDTLQNHIDALRTGQLSSVELVQQHIAHIEAHNPQINAIVQLNPGAIDAAKAADMTRAKGTIQGILHGVPITVKDSLETAGIISASGTLGRKDYVPKYDSSVVRFLKQAGAIILAKTNCPEITMPYETDNLVYGRTNNPWQLDHTPGGSSGGEGAAIAAGMSPLGVAGDAGASIRLPAHFCGITGIKPTTGRTPRTGHFPTMGGATGSMASIGLMARTVDDLILTLPLICQPDGIDAGFVPMPYYDSADVDVSTLRVAFYTDNSILAADADTAQAVVTAAQILEKAGATITETVPQGIESTIDIFLGLFGADGGLRLRQFLERLGTTRFSDAFQRIIDRLPNSAMTTADFMTLLGRVDKVRSQMLGFMQQYDVILCPVAAYPAPLHGALLDADANLSLSYTMTYNLVGYPSASVPVTLSAKGLPIGVQVVASAWREDIVLAVAKVIEQATATILRCGDLEYKK
jgi:amidase